MKKTRYEGVLYMVNRKGNKTFYARFKVDGKEYRRKIGEEPHINATTASALRFKMIDDMKNGISGDTLKIDDIFERYIILRSPTLSHSWEYNMKKTYDKHLKSIIGYLVPEAVQSHIIQAKMNAMLAEGYAVSTVKQLKDCVGGMYSHMLKTMVNIGHGLNLPKFDNKVYFNIGDDEAKRLYEVITNYEFVMWRIYFSFLLHGRRRGETSMLKWEDIDPGNSTYIIEAKNNKTGKRIEAPMLKFLVDMFEDYKVESGYIFTGRYGDLVSKSAIDHHWMKIRERAGLPNIRLHDLRHLMGYIAVNNGFSLEEIAQVLGHDSIATTKRYSNMSKQTAKRTLEAIHEKLR